MLVSDLSRRELSRQTPLTRGGHLFVSCALAIEQRREQPDGMRYWEVNCVSTTWDRRVTAHTQLYQDRAWQAWQEKTYDFEREESDKYDGDRTYRPLIYDQHEDRRRTIVGSEHATLPVFCELKS
jgi:hypothetical protein